MEELKVCFLCGKNGNGDPLERHHIFGGSNRKHSERYGLTVWLCGNECHRNGKHSAHRDGETAKRLHEFGERKFLNETGKTVDEFISIFGKNYLEE